MIETSGVSIDVLWVFDVFINGFTDEEKIKFHVSLMKKKLNFIL